MYSKAAEILRTTKIEQCTGAYELQGEMCAIGVLTADLLYGTRTQVLRREYGISLTLRSEIENMNDQGCTFKEIADWLSPEPDLSHLLPSERPAVILDELVLAAGA